MSGVVASPMSDASCDCVSLPIVTLMDVAPFTTWALVRRSPSGVNTIPVPAPPEGKNEPGLKSWVRTYATAGPTLARMPCTSDGLAITLELCDDAAGTVTVLVESLCIKAETPAPAPAPASTAAATTAASQLRGRAGAAGDDA